MTQLEERGVDTATASPARRVPSRTSLIEVATYAAVALVALFIAACVLQLQDASLNNAWVYSGDALFQTGIVKGVIENGWYLNNPQIGVPLGSFVADFASVNGDFSQLLLIKVIGVFFDGPFTVINIFFLLTFPLNAISAFWASRHLGVSRGPAMLVAVLYSVLPYHFWRNIGHIFFSSYYTVPLACVLILDVVAGRPLFRARAQNGRLTRWITPKSVFTIVLCLLVGSTSSYYSAFAFILLVVAALLRGLGSRDLRGLVVGLIVAFVVAGTIVAVQFPTLISRAEHGENPLVAKRGAQDSEIYGLKLAQLVFPTVYHRVDALAQFSRHYEGTTPLPSETGGNLGAIGTVGLGWLIVVALASLASPRAARIASDRERHTALIAIVAFLIATVSGISAVIAYVVTPQIRGWNRMSIFIAFFALLSAGYLLDRWRERVTGRAGLVVFAGALVSLMVLGVLDQTSPQYAPAYAEVSAKQDVVDEFVAEAARVLPTRSEILQLPHLPYPENGPINGMADYDHLRPYLSDSSLRFSYGALKGGRQDWLGALSGAPLPVLLDVSAALGFDALYVDQAAYADVGQALSGALDAELGPALVRSSDDRLVLWDLRGRRAELANKLDDDALNRLRTAGKRPVRGFLVEGFGVPTMLTGRGVADAKPDARVTLQNQLPDPQWSVLQVALSRVGDGSSSVQLDFPDGTRRTVHLSDEPQQFTHRFRVPPGTSTIRLTSQGGGTRLVDPLLIPIDACVGQAASESPTTDDCTTGTRVQVP